MLRSACQYLLQHASVVSSDLDLQAQQGILNIKPSSHCCNDSLPANIATILKKLNIEPRLSKSFCCMKCYSMYPLETKEQACSYRATRRSQICSEPLFFDPPNHKKQDMKPCQFYTTHSLLEWLGHLTSRIFLILRLKPDDGSMRDVWDSPMWGKQKNPDGSPFTSTTGHLAFSLGINWFNPWGNKAAGKMASLGALVLVCLNLPLSHRYRPKNIYLAGITPGPKEPTVYQTAPSERPFGPLARRQLLRHLVLWDFLGTRLPIIFARSAKYTRKTLTQSTQQPWSFEGSRSAVEIRRDESATGRNFSGVGSPLHTSAEATLSTS
ncbi:hypothetical protein MJO28_006589, partial [Puccinia striiformis f. sp. tritici]